VRVLICGDRRWSDEDAMRRFVDQLPADAVVIHGAARGADRMAGRLAQQRELEVKEFPADWKRYGRAAGPVRNKQMLEVKPDVVAYAHDDLEASKGTKDMVKQALKAGVAVRNIRDR
jgi:hypothetical protein